METLKKLFIDEKYTNRKAIRAAASTLVAFAMALAFGADVVSSPEGAAVEEAIATLVMAAVAGIGSYLYTFWGENETKEVPANVDKTE